jgi:hypothetical protein
MASHDRSRRIPPRSERQSFALDYSTIGNLPKTAAALGTEQMFHGKIRVDTNEVRFDESPSFLRNRYMDWETTESSKDSYCIYQYIE